FMFPRTSSPSINSVSEVGFPLFLLLSPLGGAEAPVNHFRVHQANLFGLKCEALPFRTLVRDDACFFAINSPLRYSDGSDLCQKTMPTSTLHTGRVKDYVLKEMFLN
ncbi:hypothetical protein PMAYCL1PPCAC_27515, partial [Pristionchus mayeri]